MKKLIFVLLICLTAVAGYACDCPPDSLNEKNIRSYDFIFAGKVVAVSGCDQNAQVTFEVQHLFKGKSFQTVSVAFDCLSDCQMNFAPGEEWIIYSNYVSYGNAKVNFCSLSRRKSSGQEDDYYLLSHGISFDDEVEKLKTIFGEQELSKKDIKQEQHHQLIHPQGMQLVWYSAAGLVGLLVFFFLVKKFLK